MPEDPESKQELEEIAAHLAAAERSGLPLFGLIAPGTESRSLNGIGGHDDDVNLVTLSHQIATDTRIDVTITGPLHGRAAGGEWSIDPSPMIVAELLNHAGEEFTSGAELNAATEGLQRQRFDDVQILVDGRPWPFRLLRNGDHWAALHDIEPGYLLYIVASNTAPIDVELGRLEDLTAYSHPLPG